MLEELLKFLNSKGELDQWMQITKCNIFIVTDL